jgi:phosphate/sulfate permease
MYIEPLLIPIRSWIMTIPIAGLIGGLIMGITLNTPNFNKK